MVDNKKDVVLNKDFISYIDDDGLKKDQFIFIISETDTYVEFKFDLNDTQSIKIPWHKINKIKKREK